MPRTGRLPDFDKSVAAYDVKGVFYDSARGMFTATVYRNKARHFLGRFKTLDEAAAAVDAFKDANPRERDPDRLPTVKERVAEFYREVERDARDFPKPGSVLTLPLPDGGEQAFKLVKVTFRKQGGKSRPYAQFSSSCKVCGAAYETLAALTRGDTANVAVTRTCEDHRRGLSSYDETEGGTYDEAYFAAHEAYMKELRDFADNIMGGSLAEAKAIFDRNKG